VISNVFHLRPALGIGLTDVYDGTSPIGRIGAQVVDVHLVGRAGADIFRVGAADVDATIRVIAYPELGEYFKILVRAI